MKRLLLAALFASLAAARPAGAAETVLPIEGDVPMDGPDHFFVPFEVKAGTVELEVRHDDLSEANILDWGLEDPSGFRGWGGGNPEPAVVGVDGASRSYVPGPIAAGTWRVIVGKAKVVETPARYRLEIVLRDAPTLPAQPERAPYQPAPALALGPRWYAGDFHVHSWESGDARPKLDEIADFARGRGLDFVMVSDHDTITAQDYFRDAQQRHPDLLFVPGMEWTTYRGHANALGVTEWIDHKLGQPGVTVESAAAAVHAQGGLFSVNHPKLDFDTCIGCGWSLDLPVEQLDALEIENGGLQPVGQLFIQSVLAMWDDLSHGGHHITAIGGSDDHQAGQDTGATASPIGDPTTMVYASELSAAALINGVRHGRTVVKLQGPDDPMIELSPSVAPGEDDVIRARELELRVRVTGGEGAELRLVHEGEPQEPLDVTSDPFEASFPLTGGDAEERWRAEVLVGGRLHTVTSHLWLKAPDPGAGRADAAEGGGCGCRLGAEPQGTNGALATLALGLALARRRRRR